MKKMIYVGDGPRIIIGFGVFDKGDTANYDETLFATGLFEEVKEDKKKASEK